MQKMDLLGGCNLTKEQNIGRRITLYHGSPKQIVTPAFGGGKDNHDYGRGFYLTPNRELTMEWARGRGQDVPGWLHTYTLDCTELSVLDFEQLGEEKAIYWVAELLKHRTPDDRVTAGRRVSEKSKRFLLQHYNCGSDSYDVVCGWRADDSYFQIAQFFLTDQLYVELLESALRLGNLGIQYCCKSEKAFANLRQVCNPEAVPNRYADAFMRRDRSGRQQFYYLVDSPANSEDAPGTLLRDLVRSHQTGGGTR